MDELPRLAQEFKLNGDAVEGLKQHLQSELDYLSNLPQDVTLQSIMENHFKSSSTFREGVTGKKD